jgi:hypothetical protein
VQEADDEERGSANAKDEETGECKNAIERGKWGHPSSRHSCNGPAPRSSERGEWGHPSSRHSCNGSAPGSTLAQIPRTLANALAPSARSRSQCTGKRLVYKGESGRSANWKSRLRTITLQSRTEPLEIIYCKLTKNLTAFT